MDLLVRDLRDTLRTRGRLQSFRAVAPSLNLAQDRHPTEKVGGSTCRRDSISWPSISLLAFDHAVLGSKGSSAQSIETCASLAHAVWLMSSLRQSWASRSQPASPSDSPFVGESSSRGRMMPGRPLSALKPRCRRPGRNRPLHVSL